MAQCWKPTRYDVGPTTDFSGGSKLGQHLFLPTVSQSCVHWTKRCDANHWFQCRANIGPPEVCYHGSELGWAWHWTRLGNVFKSQTRTFTVESILGLGYRTCFNLESVCLIWINCNALCDSVHSFWTYGQDILATECPQNSHRMSTEYSQNVHRMACQFALLSRWNLLYTMMT